jgi:hypothetical protein
MKQSSDQPLEAGELYVWVPYDPAPEGSYYPELHSGFRNSGWGSKGYEAAILFVEIAATSLLPGQTKRVRAYTLNSANFAQWIITEKVYWGPSNGPLAR